MSIHVIRRAGPPNFAPPQTVIHYFDTVSGLLYFSVGTSSVADWVISGNTGITQLTSDVLAGPGNGSQAATVAFVGGATAAAIATAAADAHIHPNLPALNAVSGVNSGDVTLNIANGLSLVGQVLSLALSSSSTTGSLTSTDWNTFNNKVSATRTISTTAPLSGGGDLSADRTLSISQATAIANGYLSSTDWNTFNNKQNALTIGNLTDVGTDGITITNGSGAVIGSGTSISQHVADSTHNGYLTSTDWATFNNKIANVSGQNHATLSNLSFATSGHTGFEPTQTKGSISEVTSGVLTISNGANSTVGPNVTVQVKQATNLQSGYLSSSDWSTFNNKADYSDTQRVKQYTSQVSGSWYPNGYIKLDSFIYAHSPYLEVYKVVGLIKTLIPSSRWSGSNSLTTWKLSLYNGIPTLGSLLSDRIVFNGLAGVSLGDTIEVRYIEKNLIISELNLNIKGWDFNTDTEVITSIQTDPGTTYNSSIPTTGWGSNLQNWTINSFSYSDNSAVPSYNEIQYIDSFLNTKTIQYLIPNLIYVKEWAFGALFPNNCIIEVYRASSQVKDIQSAPNQHIAGTQLNFLGYYDTNKMDIHEVYDSTNRRKDGLYIFRIRNLTNNSVSDWLSLRIYKKTRLRLKDGTRLDAWVKFIQS
jgi:hypothetical protein